MVGCPFGEGFLERFFLLVMSWRIISSFSIASSMLFCNSFNSSSRGSIGKGSSIRTPTCKDPFYIGKLIAVGNLVSEKECTVTTRPSNKLAETISSRIIFTLNIHDRFSGQGTALNYILYYSTYDNMKMLSADDM